MQVRQATASSEPGPWQEETKTKAGTNNQKCAGKMKSPASGSV